MGTLDRGFKSWAERTAATLRRELELEPLAPIDPLRVASFLDVEVCTPREIPGLPADIIDPLLDGDPFGWSAVSLAINGGGLLIYNPRKSKARRAATSCTSLPTSCWTINPRQSSCPKSWILRSAPSTPNRRTKPIG